MTTLTVRAGGVVMIFLPREKGNVWDDGDLRDAIFAPEGRKHGQQHGQFRAIESLGHRWFFILRDDLKNL